MADPRLTQSPRQLRDSTEDADKHAIGSVRTDESPSKDGVGHDQPSPWRHQGEYGSEGTE